MPLRSIWQHRWPLLRWSLFLFLLVALALGLFLWLPPAPRWIVHGSFDSLGFSPDGKLLRTQVGGDSWPDLLVWFDTTGKRTQHRQNINVVRLWDLPSNSHGVPLQFWDIASGREVRRFFDAAASLDSVVFAPDGRTVYAVAHHGSNKPSVRLHRVDLETGDASSTAITMVDSTWTIYPSPNGKLLLLASTMQRPIIWDISGRAPSTRAGPSRLLLAQSEGVPEPRLQYLQLHHALSLRQVIQEDAHEWQWLWAADGEALLLYAAHDNGKASLRRITTKGESVTLFDGAGPWLGFTPDGKTLLTAWPATEDSGPGPSVLLWDAATGKRLGEIPRREPGDPPGGHMFFADSRTLVSTQDDGAGNPVAVVWDIDKHAAIGKVPLGIVPVPKQHIVVSPARDVFVIYGPWTPQTLAVYRPRPFVQLWEHDFSGALGRVEFSDDGKFLHVESGGDGDTHIQILEVATGETRLDVVAVHPHRVVRRGRFMAVEETIQLQADAHGPLREILDKCFAMVLRRPMSHADFETITRVFDAHTGEQIGRLEARGATVADLSPEGQSLFMQEDQSTGGGVLCCYDVPPAHAWPWIVGVPITVALIGLALRFGWHWLRQRRAAKTVRAQNPQPLAVQ